MSRKATSTSRMAERALAGARRTDGEARMAAEARTLAKDALDAAVAATCAARRASVPNAEGRGVAEMRRLSRNARAAAEDAVERARNAIKAEDAGDAVGARHLADLSERAACRAAALATLASVAAGASRKLAAGGEQAEPKVSEEKQRQSSASARAEDELLSQIARSARYLVTYDGAIVACLAREEDAFLLESELADLDRAHNAATGRCEVIERKSGKRLGGYMLAGGKMVVFLRDEDAEKRFAVGRGRRER